MLKNYIKIALRSLLKQKLFSFINILGLACGIACCLLITLWVLDQISYDKFHKDADRIFQVLTHGSLKNNPSTPLPFAPVFKETFPEILYATRYEGYDDALISRGDKMFFENGIVVVDPDFFNIFSFPFIRGNPGAALNSPDMIVITEKIADKYFPGEDPLGQTLTMNHKKDYIVSGILKDNTQNSTLNFDIAICYEVRLQNFLESGYDPTDWGTWSPNTFLKIKDNVSLEEFNAKIANVLHRYDEEEDATISVLPFTQRNNFFWNTKMFITIYSLIGIIILAMACINFMNLTTARSASRTSEVGIRKITGANRVNLIQQFMGESFVQVFLALFCAILLTDLLLPLFNALTGVELDFNLINNHILIIIVLGLLIITGLVSGSYPALYLSAFKPVHVLGKELKVSSGKSMFRRILVIIQFSISVWLIINTGIINKQFQYMRNANIGWQSKNLIEIPLEGDSKNFFSALKSELLKGDLVVNVTGVGDDLPHFQWSTSSGKWDGKIPEEKYLLYFNPIDYDFVETLELKITAGRSFSKEFPSDATNGLIINEKFAGLIGSDNIIGKQIELWGINRVIVGVIEDCHFQPLTRQIMPRLFLIDPEHTYHLVIRLSEENTASALQFVEEAWKRIVPLYPFQYRFVEDRLSRSYISIERMGNLTGSFTVVAVIIACLGLLGLISFSAEQRSKEIGIRKVLGSSVAGIVLLLSRELTKCVIIANIIAWPVAYIVANNWLQNFAFRIRINYGFFLIALGITIVLTALTISYQAIKAGRVNPADRLRYE